MKKCSTFIIVMSFLAILSACSANTNLELIETKVDIINDEKITGSMTLQEGEKAGQEVVPTSLYYTFTIKNKRNKESGDLTEGLTARIEPNDKLVAVSKEIMGFNLFNPTEYNNSGLGYGQSFNGVIRPKIDGQYVLIYELGINEETIEAPLVPSKEKLDKLKNNAMEGTLIISFGNEEIARFDLSKTE